MKQLLDENIVIEDDEESSEKTYTTEETGEPEVVFAREAAIIKLGMMLDKKTHGDRISAADIQEATDGCAWDSFRKQILAWAKRRKFVVFAVTNDGYRVGTAREHLDFAESKRKKAFAAEKRGLGAMLDAVPKLDSQKDVRLFEFHINKAAVRVTNATRDNLEIRKELKLDRVPLRKIEDK